MRLPFIANFKGEFDSIIKERVIKLKDYCVDNFISGEKVCEKISNIPTII
jgi:hypothetical protein